MSFAPLVLRGNLTIGSVNVSDQVTSFSITGTRNVIDVPATFGNRVVGAKAGSEQWSVTVNYIQGDAGDALDTLSEIFWDAVTSENFDGEVTFSGTLNEEPGADIYAGTFVVSEVTHGGDAETLGTASATFRMTGRPTKVLGS